MAKIAVIEDNDKDRSRITEYLNRYGNENQVSLSITEFCDGIHILNNYRSEWDIILLDIEMPLKDGMSTARCIRELDKNVVIMFVTNMAQYAIQGYEVEALDYIWKPISYTAFAMKLAKALRVIESRNTKSIVFKADGAIHRIPVRDVLYVEVQGHTLSYHTREGSWSIKGNYTLNSVEEELEGMGFSKCNRCFLVNLSNVTKLERDTVYVGTEGLLISRTRKKEFVNDLLYHFGGNIE